MTLRGELSEARSAAVYARMQLDSYGARIEDGSEGDVALAVLLAARAVLCAIHEHATTIAYYATGEPK